MRSAAILALVVAGAALAIHYDVASLLWTAFLWEVR